MYECFDHVCICSMCIPRAHKAQKVALLEQEHSVGTRNQTSNNALLQEHSKCFLPLSRLSSPVCFVELCVIPKPSVRKRFGVVHPFQTQFLDN